MDFEQRAAANAVARKNSRRAVWPAHGLITAGTLLRCAAIGVIAQVERRPADAVLLERAGDEPLLPLVLRSTQAPASTAVAGWAAELGREVREAFGDWLRPTSGLLQLQTVNFTFDGAARLVLPRRARQASPNVAAGFRAEGAPIRVGGATTESITLAPKSMGVIATYTRELAKRSISDLEVIISDMMAADTSLALDGVFFGANAGTATTPPGVRFGADSHPATGATPAQVAADLRGMLERMAARRGSRARWAFAMSEDNLTALQLMRGTGDSPAFPSASALPPTICNVPIITTLGLDDSIVLLIDGAEVWAAWESPTFDVADAATLHEEGATPLPIAASGTPNTVAAPTRSLWQTGTVALRMTAAADWSTGPGATQELTAVSW